MNWEHDCNISTIYFNFMYEGITSCDGMRVSLY